jgi:hypothetical protein
MRIAVFVFFMWGLPLFADSQSTIPDVIRNTPDTVLFNNGKVLAVHVVDSSAATITIEKLNSHKHKKIEIDKEEVFSVRYGKSGKEEVYYVYDTLVEHDYTVEEARRFIAGEQDAQRGYHAIGVSIAAFSIGFGSGVAFGSAFSFGPPFLFAGIMTYPTVRVKHKSVHDMKNASSDSYLEGYDITARRKRTLHSFVWSGIGLAAGMIAHFVLLNNQ